MTSVLIFVGVCCAIVAIGWTVSRITGSRAWYVDDWHFDEGEAVIWRDDRADVAVVTRLGQAAIKRVLRLHRWNVVVTTQRIIVGLKTLGGRHMVQYVLYPGPAPDGQSDRLDGGLLTRGYTTLIVARVATPHVAEGTTVGYVVLKPVAAAASSVNMAEFRIYSDAAAGFRMP